MITLRIRGLYAAALTTLFRQYPEECEVVQPDDEIRTRLPLAWRMEPADVDIEMQVDAQGNRDALRLSGSASAVQQAVEILRRQCFDVLVQQSGSQIGAVYMGLIGLVSQAQRRAVIYMGDDLVGLLPLRYEERGLQVGSYIPVRIDAPPEAGEYRPQVSNVLSVPGNYVVLTTAPGVRLSKQISNEAERERLHNLGAAQRLEGWGLIWRTAAQDTDAQLLVDELQRLTREARVLKERVAAATSVGYVYGGDVVAHVLMTGHAKMVCDQLRAAMMPTLPGHHKYKAQGDAYHAVVDALEKELPPDMLRARTANLNVLSSVNAMQHPLYHTLQIRVQHVDGSVSMQPDAQPVGYDIAAGWVDVRQLLTRPEQYPADLSMDQQPGDYTLTRFHEGGWYAMRRFYGRDGAWKGEVAWVTTPVAIFTDQIHLVELGITVTRRPSSPPAVKGVAQLQEYQAQNVVSAALVQRARAEADTLVQQMAQSDTASA